MTVYFESECDTKFPFDGQTIAENVLEAALDELGCPYEAEVSLTVTTDDEIRVINREQRGIDAPTDVLSFPMTGYERPGDFAFLENEQVDCFHPDSGELMLGDIVISADRVYAQAEEYGHSLLREYAFLITHSILHLVGFDHMEPADADLMEQKQRQILEKLRITRGTDKEESIT